MPTREIAWNAGEVAIVVMYALMAIQGLLIAYGLTRRYLVWRQGATAGPLGKFGQRLRKALAVMFLHQRLIRPGYVYAGVMHLFIFWGFVILFVGTIIVLLEADVARPYFGISFYQGAFYVAFKLIINLFGLLFVIGLLMAIWRRYGQRLPKFRRNLTDDAVVLGLLLWLGLSGFLLQALRLAATAEPSAPIHWVSYPIALAMWNVDRASLQSVHSVMWWLHMLSNTVLIAYIPVSKLFHLFTGPANVFLRAPEPKWAAATIDNIEEQEHFGADKLADFNWKQLVGVDACMRCGRCLDFCPTFNTGKPLKPRQLIIETSAFMASQSGIGAGVAGPRPSEAGVRGNELVSADEPSIARLPLAASLIGDVVSEDEIWDCTTCRACMEQCPVLIEHVPLITELRRNLVLEQSKFPQELQILFNNLERNGNPYSFPASTRADWAQGLGVRMLAEVEDPSTIEVLYWVGCMSSFDDRNKKVATSLVKVLQSAGVELAILGMEESCSGDPARRAGNEYLFQILAQQNVETLNRYAPKRIVANCPHCFNTLKNEYPAFGGTFQVVSHSELIQELIASGRLPVSSDAASAPDGYAYHDPCYLGRYNQVYEPPRQVLIQIEGSFKEMPRHRDRGFCCGAGGARAFMEEKRGTRISHNRLNEAIGTGAAGIAVACPFCVTMFEDGAKGLNVDETFAVRDIAELVAARMNKEADSSP
jgi:Fe-S oxidoreductase/nitrate reductase gamma subunit